MRNEQRLIICFGVVLAFLIVSIGTTAAAEVPVEEWNKTFGGTTYAGAHSVQQTADGGFILAGYTHSYGDGNSDAWLIKTNDVGVEQWNRTFGVMSVNCAHSVQQTPDGGFVLAGSTYSYEEGDFDAWLIKTNNVGVEQWNKTFGGTLHDCAMSVQQTTDGGFILAGYTDSYGDGNSDAWLIKTNNVGVEQWNKTFGDITYDVAHSVQQTADGGFVLAGYKESYENGNYDAWLIKTNDAGVEQWNKTFGGTHTYGYDGAFSVQQTADGGFILAGYTYSLEDGDSDAWLIKTNDVGVEQWNRTFSGTYTYDEAWSVQQTVDGGFILVGESSYSGNYDDCEAWLIKTNDMGVEQWNKTFDDRCSNFIKSVQQTTDGGYILAGYTDSYGSGNYDVWLIKVAGTDSDQAPDQAIEDLQDYVNSLEDVGDTSKCNLDGKLGVVIHKLEKGDQEKAIKKLEKLIDFVYNPLLKQGMITEEEGKYIINEAERIIQLIRNLEG